MTTKLQLPLRVFCANNVKGNDVELIIINHPPSDRQWQNFRALSDDTDSQGQPKTIAVVVLENCDKPNNSFQPLALTATKARTLSLSSRVSARWFQGTREIQLCGSALVATAYALDQHLNISLPQPLRHRNTEFELHHEELSQDALLGAALAVQRYGFSMPRATLQASDLPLEAKNWLGVSITHAMTAGNESGYWVLEVSEALDSLTPDFNSICATTDRAIIATQRKAAGKTDYCLRYFAPQYGINEDIATGSANAIAACYWHEKIGKSHLIAEQLPANYSGGRFYLTLDHDTVKVFGEVQENG